MIPWFRPYSVRLRQVWVKAVLRQTLLRVLRSSQFSVSLLIQSSITDAKQSRQSTASLSDTRWRVWSFLNTRVFGGGQEGTGTVLSSEYLSNPLPSFHLWPILIIFHPVYAGWAHYRPQYLRTLMQFSFNCIKICHSLRLNSGFSTIKLLRQSVVIITGYRISISKFMPICKVCQFLLLMMKDYFVDQFQENA